MDNFGYGCNDFILTNYDHGRCPWEHVLVSLEVIWRPFQEFDGIDPRAL
jgi:hypothetical protein